MFDRKYIFNPGPNFHCYVRLPGVYRTFFFDRQWSHGTNRLGKLSVMIQTIFDHLAKLRFAAADVVGKNMHKYSIPQIVGDKMHKCTRWEKKKR